MFYFPSAFFFTDQIKYICSIQHKISLEYSIDQGFEKFTHGRKHLVLNTINLEKKYVPYAFF